MNKEQLEMNRKWVTALRSGEYRQGRSYLRRITIQGETQFCCLGVLAHLAGVSTEDIGAVCYDDAVLHIFPSPDGHTDLRYGGYQAYQMPPGEWFLDLTGISAGEMCEFASLNDQGHAFDAIADKIESYLPKS